uniref:Tr-type G domain-containing protein n=1 Tax=Trichobilharzia regenti TaxID=157069 RepID=A0AA85J6P4_TRIRE|nr:unnamed protein product [Trichobilharzia regenti]
MSRHRNIRALCDDDVDTYDEVLASSVDDDYTVSPNTTERYIYNPNRGFKQDIPIFPVTNNEPLSFTAEDFPVNEAGKILPDSPGDVSGRISSQQTFDFSNHNNVESKNLKNSKQTVDDVFGHSDLFDSSSCVTQVCPTDEDKSLDTLNLSLSQKLAISQSDGRPNVLRTPVSNAPATPSKPIDRHSLVSEYAKLHKGSGDKQIINLIVMGHVDAGKSTLMGNLLYLLGHVSGKQLAKYQWDAQKMGKASFAYAWILDQTSEERSRGVTMDIAQTSFETKSKRVALMDAPGHKDFVPQVIGGATQADAALLVINATRGEFETGIGTGGQTREHARLARLLGVSRLIVAVNKMDTVDWCQSRYDEIQSQVSGFLKSMNFSGVVFCPVSGLIGTNLVPQDITSCKNSSESSSKLFQWYSGPCLLDLIDSIPSPERTVNGPFRFVVSDIFKPAGSSIPAVVGRVVSGAVSAGVNLPTSRVICLPSDVRACVKSIRSLCNSRSGLTDTAEGDLGGKLLDQVVKFAFAGDQVALMLADIDPFQALIPGDLITDPDNPIPPATCILAKLLVFAIRQPITRGYPVIYYYNCTSVAANITKLKSMTHKENKVEKTVKKPRLVICILLFLCYVTVSLFTICVCVCVLKHEGSITCFLSKELTVIICINIKTLRCDVKCVIH